jgi:hypothetical protein
VFFDDISVETSLSRAEGMCQKEVLKLVFKLSFMTNQVFILEAR